MRFEYPQSSPEHKTPWLRSPVPLQLFGIHIQILSDAVSWNIPEKPDGKPEPTQHLLRMTREFFDIIAQLFHS